MVITKTFSFEYAHRVHTQTYGPCKCRRMHGHSGTMKVVLRGAVQADGMMVDFGELDFIKAMVDEWLDHRTLVSENDPLLDTMLLGHSRDTLQYYTLPDEKYRMLRRLREFPHELGQDERDWLSSFIICSFIPTSEHLAEFFSQLIDRYLAATPHLLHTRVKCVQWSETGKTTACWMADDEPQQSPKKWEFGMITER